jgi:hypothetical protein
MEVIRRTFVRVLLLRLPPLRLSFEHPFRRVFERLRRGLMLRLRGRLQTIIGRTWRGVLFGASLGISLLCRRIRSTTFKSSKLVFLERRKNRKKVEYTSGGNEQAGGRDVSYRVQKIGWRVGSLPPQ